jgi:PAS domain S-box-containing protein
VVAVAATLVMTIATIFLNFGSPNIPAFMLFFMVALIIQQSTYRLHHAMVQEQKKSRELRESEEKYRRLIDLLPIGVLVNQDGKVVMINPAGMKMAGANTPDEVLGASLLKFVHPDFREKALERMQTAFAKGINARPIEQQLLRLDGSSFDAESTGLIFTYNGRPAILAIFNDISERKQAREAILAQNKRIEEMSGLLLDIQEKERRLLATELHDDLGQSLTSLKLMLELCSRARSTTNRQKKMAEARGLVSELMEKVRNLSLDLRPTVLDDYGLFAALRWFVDRFKAQTGLAVHCNYDPECSRRFAPHVETAAFRIIQEALTNVARHASVAKAEVSISTDGPLAIEVADAGLGFDVGHALQSTDHSAGLSGMQERARLLGGRVDILSNPGVGTRVVAHIPLNGGGR